MVYRRLPERMKTPTTTLKGRRYRFRSLKPPPLSQVSPDRPWPATNPIEGYVVWPKDHLLEGLIRSRPTVGIRCPLKYTLQGHRTLNLVDNVTPPTISSSLGELWEERLFLGFLRLRAWNGERTAAQTGAFWVEHHIKQREDEKERREEK